MNKQTNLIEMINEIETEDARKVRTQKEKYAINTYGKTILKLLSWELITKEEYQQMSEIHKNIMLRQLSDKHV